MAAVATAGLSKEELAHRWNEIVEQFERVDLDGWIIETNQYGQILMSPLPEGAHQYRGSIVTELLGAYFPDHRAFYEKPVLTDLGVKNADVVLVAPDQNEQALGSKALSPAPEICVEILSPSNTQEEIDEKRAAYLRAGAKEVWICDRNNRMIFFAPSGQLARSRLCPDFPLELDLSQRPINKLQQQLLAAYNQLVRTPEDRARLEKENPDLVAERDRIVTTQKRMLLAQQQIQSEPHTQKRSSG
jgi:Uma2 family endonuclease